jgi:hypothetical protein
MSVCLANAYQRAVWSQGWPQVFVQPFAAFAAVAAVAVICSHLQSFAVIAATLFWSV